MDKTCKNMNRIIPIAILTFLKKLVNLKSEIFKTIVARTATATIMLYLVWCVGVGMV